MSRGSDFVTTLAQLVGESGGEIVGRTRLQKVAFVLQSCGYEMPFSFQYKHYGPFSEELASTAELASITGVVSERRRPSGWGGTYSIYQAAEIECADVSKKKILDILHNSNAITLELAATAIFLREEVDDPWSETAKRKPAKVGGGRLREAKDLVAKITEVVPALEVVAR